LRDTHLYRLRTAGELVEIVCELNELFDRTLEPVWQHREAELAPEPRTRGVVQEFSEKSRRRLANNRGEIPWGSFPFLFITVTYPGEFVTGGREIGRHLDNLRRAWTDGFGLPLAVWKMEFQRRGAPHFHLAIAAPDGIPIEVVRRWISATWYRIVSSGDERHLRAGTQVEAMIRPPVAYFSSHGAHGRDKKGYQNEIAERYESADRFWGFWNLAPDWVEHELDRDEVVQLRRMMPAWARANGYQVRRNGGRIQGMWLRTRRRPSMHFGAQLLRALEVCST